MRISKNGLSLIKRFEGCRLTVYLDPVGVPTVGYGHTAGLTRDMVGMPITQAVADVYLEQDITKFEQKVNRFNGIYHWTQQEFDALVSFAYNIGSIDKLTQNGKRNKAQIAQAMLSYNKAGGKVLQGLVKRRKAEHDLFVSGNKKDITTLAKEVLADKWGIGAERKRRLTQAGYDYQAVQKEVNRLLKEV